jgi:hypothetical protein
MDVMPATSKDGFIAVRKTNDGSRTAVLKCVALRRMLDA